MGLISRFGKFLDNLFAAKVTVDEFNEFKANQEVLTKLFNAQATTHDTSINELMGVTIKQSEDILKLRDELNAIKAFLRVGRATETPAKTPQRFDGSQAWKR